MLAKNAGVGARALRRALVVAQVGFAFVLLVGAGLLFASFRQVMAVDPGFNVDGVLTASITLPRTRYPDDDKLRAFTDEALRRLRALPGVSAAGATDTIPLGNNNNDSVIIAEGYQMKPGESVLSPSRVELSLSYFDARASSCCAAASTIVRRRRSRRSSSTKLRSACPTRSDRRRRTAADIKRR